MPTALVLGALCSDLLWGLPGARETLMTLDIVIVVNLDKARLFALAYRCLLLASRDESTAWGDIKRGGDFALQGYLLRDYVLLFIGYDWYRRK